MPVRGRQCTKGSRLELCPGILRHEQPAKMQKPLRMHICWRGYLCTVAFPGDHVFWRSDGARPTARTCIEQAGIKTTEKPVEAELLRLVSSVSVGQGH